MDICCNTSRLQESTSKQCVFSERGEGGGHLRCLMSENDYILVNWDYPISKLEEKNFDLIN